MVIIHHRDETGLVIGGKYVIDTSATTLMKWDPSILDF
jgi:hypothetical protein